MGTYSFSITLVGKHKVCKHSWRAAQIVNPGSCRLARVYLLYCDTALPCRWLSLFQLAGSFGGPRWGSHCSHRGLCAGQAQPGLSVKFSRASIGTVSSSVPQMGKCDLRTPPSSSSWSRKSYVSECFAWEQGLGSSAAPTPIPFCLALHSQH